jgi:Domain of unknown function (DUF222)/HNH endonuclease
MGSVLALDEHLDHRLEDELDEIAGFLNAQHARLVDVTARLLARPGTWQVPGIHTIEQYLCWRTGISAAHAHQIATIAKRVDELPACMETFRRGELSLDQMTAIVRKTPAWADHRVAELAPMLTVRQLQRTLGKYRFPDLPDHDAPEDRSADDTESERESIEPDPVEGPQVAPPGAENSCRFWFGDDGRFHLHLEGDQLSGMIIDQALREAHDVLFQHGHTDATWYDAFLEIAERSLDAIDSPARRNRWRINMHLRTDGRCTDETGYQLPDAIRRYLTCDGLLSPVFYTNGVPVSVGRSQHIVPDRTRRIVILRDGGCGVPGCGCDQHIEVHHIIHWEDDGPSDTWNLISLCPHHHRLHHQGKLGITGNADTSGGITLTDAEGRIITASGARPRPPGAPPPPITGNYQHPLGERLDMKWVSFGTPPDHRQTPANQEPRRPADIAWP